MPEEQPRSIRKGTKSCTECRRRKVRCIPAYDARICRGCEDRNLECTAQTSSSKTPMSRTLSSQTRIVQLESQVQGLNKAVRHIERQLVCRATSTLESQSSIGQELEINSPGNDSCVSAPDQPAHLRFLFQNDWLSVDGQQNKEHMHEHTSTGYTHSLDTARQALQNLIPSKDEISDLTEFASEWLEMLYAFFPLSFTASSRQEVLDCYEQMHTPDVDTMTLASWLLTVAIAVEQMPEKHEGSATWLRRGEGPLRLSRAISHTMETIVLCNDNLIGSIQGLTASMLFIRLKIGRGDFHKAWIRLRHVIAIAELMGLHRIGEAVQANKVTGTIGDETRSRGVQLWQLISATDSLLGMMLNLPPSTTQYNRINGQALCINGVVQHRVYLTRLTDIAGRIQYLDDMNRAHGPNTKLHISALELAAELRDLASQTPDSWWNRALDRVEPDHLVQFMHYYITMRIYLPFTLRQDPDGQYLHTVSNCIHACESVVERYQVLVRKLPVGFFLSEILDLQAFTAIVILLLTSHSHPSANRLNLRIDKTGVQMKVVELIELMREKARGLPSLRSIHHFIDTICSLIELLQVNENNIQVPQSTLQIPLLGQLHIRPNIRTLRRSGADNVMPGQTSSDQLLFERNNQLLPLPLSSATTNPPILVAEDMPWGDLSWYLEDNYCKLFEDGLW